MGLPSDQGTARVKGDNYVHYAQGTVPLQTFKLWNKLCSRNVPKVMHQVIQGCEGVQNILDDTIVHAPKQEEHDRRLQKVLNVLQEKEIVLYWAKC